MQEQRVINGWIYEKSADGRIERKGPAPSAAPQTSGMPTVIPLPVNPVRAAKDLRDSQREDKRDDRAERSADRADAAAVRADKTQQRLADAAAASANAAAKPGEFQAKSSGFYGRMTQAEKFYNAIPEAGRAPRSLSRETFRSVAPGLENKGSSPERQKADQAIEDFISASLRLESGAAIGKDEFERQYRIFFPRPDDSAQVIAQKAEARRQAIDGFRIAAGPLAAQIDEAQSKRPIPGQVTAASPTPPPDGSPLDLSGDIPEGEVLLGYSPQPDGSRAPVYGKPGTKLGEGFEQSYAGQAISGINEGIAGLVGAPVDLTTAAINLVPQGLNAIANTDIPTIEDPVAGSNWWKDRMKGWAIFDPSTDTNKQFTRRIGESVGSAAIPLGGAASTVPRFLAQLGIGAGGGAGAATAQQAFPGNPYAEMAGEVLGGGLTGYGMLRGAQRTAQRGIEDAIPTVDDLKEQAGEMYRAAEARGVTADPQMTTALSDLLRQTLRDEGSISPTGRISEVYPKAREAMQLVDDYAGQPMTPTQLQTVRKVLTDTGRSPENTERRLGSLLTEAFDGWAAPIAPELPAARDVASRYLNAEKLEEARELAGVRAGQFTGSGFENALRTDYRALDRNAVKGREQFPSYLTDAIQRVSRGTTGSNIARNIGRFAPTGPVSSMAAATPILAGGTFGGPMGAVAGASLGLAGMAGRQVATNMGIRNADVAEYLARNGGPIEQAPLVPDAFRELSARIAAVQQAKYLSERGGN